MAQMLGGPVAASDLCVDPRNTTGLEDGSPRRPFRSVQAAVDRATSGDVVKVARGSYRERIVVHATSLTLLGGFVGADSYATGEGNFTARSDDPTLTTLEGTHDTAVVRLTDATHSAVTGFHITGGRHGVTVDDEAWPSVVTDVVISGNLIEGNGEAEEHGGGISALGASLRVSGNTIRDNVGANAGGVYLHHCSDAVVEDNLIDGNRGHLDHGGGLVLNGSGVVRGNTIRGNRIGESVGYGWGGGVLVVEEQEAPVLLSHNTICDNYAPSAGGGVFVDEGATATLDHCLIVGNRTLGSGGGLYVDASWDGRRSRATVTACTLADNLSTEWPGWGGAVLAQASDIVLKDCIVWGNLGLDGPDDFAVVDGGTLSAVFTLSAEALPGAGNLTADPLFADPGQGDYHVRSRAGRWDPAGADGEGTWVRDAESSPAIDAGDPAAAFDLEPEPNGGRVNLGAFGNTAEASRSGPGPDKRVRRHLLTGPR